LTRSPSSASPASPKPEPKEPTAPQAIGSALKRAVSARIPGAEWRQTNYYDAADSQGETFIALKYRRDACVIGLTLPDDKSSPLIKPNTGEFNWRRMTKVTRLTSDSDINAALLELIGEAHAYALQAQTQHRYDGIKLRQIVDSGLLPPGTNLVLMAGKNELASATITDAGEILYEGKTFETPSDKAFARLLGPTRISLNGWTHWHAVFPTGTRQLAEIRSEFIAGMSGPSQPRT
jgi:hypothetical protein